MLKEPFTSALDIIDTLEQYGYSAYFVGGAVRDWLLNKPIGDIDITTSATPEQMKRVFPNVIPVGIEHGTVIVRNNHQSYEVTTYRMETGYTDFRHPDAVLFVDNIEADLGRRDFTINAMALDKRGNLIDPYGGRSDLTSQLISTVGKPTDRFREDPLRMMRAIRFVSQLGFDLDQDTFHALSTNIHWLDKIAIERIAAELKKLFEGSGLNHALTLCKESRIAWHLPVFHKTKNLLKNVPETMHPLYSLGEMVGFFHLLDPQITIETWVKEWKLSNKVYREAATLVESINYYQRNNIDPWMVYNLPINLEAGFIRLLYNIEKHLDITQETIITMRKKLPIHDRKDLAINGNDLLNFFPGKRKGPWISEYLQLVEKRVVMRQMDNDKNVIKEWVKQWNPPAAN